MADLPGVTYSNIAQDFRRARRRDAHWKGGHGPYYLPQFMREQSRTVVRPGAQQA